MDGAVILYNPNCCDVSKAHMPLKNHDFLHCHTLSCVWFLLQYKWLVIFAFGALYIKACSQHPSQKCAQHSMWLVLIDLKQVISTAVWLSACISWRGTQCVDPNSWDMWTVDASPSKGSWYAAIDLAWPYFLAVTDGSRLSIGPSAKSFPKTQSWSQLCHVVPCTQQLLYCKQLIISQRCAKAKSCSSICSTPCVTFFLIVVHTLVQA